MQPKGRFHKPNMGSADLLQKFQQRNIPFVAFIELTNRCNLHCVHCMKSKRSLQDIPQALFRKAVEQVADLGTLNLVLSGGEPLLHRNIFDFASYAKQKNFNLRISSNGTLIHKKQITLLQTLMPLTVQISIYGAISSIHEAITQVKGSYRKTIAAIERLKDAGISVLVHMMVMRENFHQLASVREKADRKKWKFSYDFVIYPREDGSLRPLNHRITDEQLRMAYRTKLLRVADFYEPYREELPREQLNDLATISCRISPSGQVFPSGTLRYEIGNLKERSLGEIWRGSDAVRQLRDLKAGDFECSRYPCAHRCSWDIGLAFAEHWDITASPKEWCRFVKQLGKI